MSIWFKSYTLDEINKRSENTLADFLGIRFSDMGDDTLTALMPVTQKIKQPIGIVHGGANVVLAETIASTAANLVIDIEKYYAVGLEININHIRSVREGQIIAKTWPLHLGRSTSVWQIELRNEVGKVTAISRMTASILARFNKAFILIEAWNVMKRLTAKFKPQLFYAYRNFL
jgi:1,4-dihydroxy-2-naphthoyl-CoA hydrolase